MKHMNFFKTLSPQEQYTLRTWFILSGCLFITLIVAIIILQSLQLYTLYTVHHEKKLLTQQTQSFDTLMEKKHVHKKKTAELMQHIAKLERHHEQPNILAQNLEQIMAFCTPPLALASLELKKKEINITITGEKPEQALLFAQQLAQLPSCASMFVTTIHPHTSQASKGIICTLRGKLK